MCKCEKFGTAEETADKPATKSTETKCLECGCNAPGESHGITTTNDLTNFSKPSNVSTATMVNAGEMPKSAELEDQELPTEDSPTPDVEEEVKQIVEEAIKSATKSLSTEIANLVSANKAATEKAMGLENELAIAKSQAVYGGPKRTVKPIDHASNDLLVKAATYKAKADATTDPDLVKGYKALYEEFLAKHTASTESN
jgi:hypothetical protein